jgi:hypothetical protein
MASVCRTYYLLPVYFVFVGLFKGEGEKLTDMSRRPNGVR